MAIHFLIALNMFSCYYAFSSLTIRRMHYGLSRIFENASVTVYEKAPDGNDARLALREENIVPWRGKI